MKVTFDKYKSLYNEDEYYALQDPVIRTIENVRYIEVTPSLDKISAMLIRADSIKKIGTEVKHVR